jgi:hypothetical protein
MPSEGKSSQAKLDFIFMLLFNIESLRINYFLFVSFFFCLCRKSSLMLLFLFVLSYRFNEHIPSLLVLES